MFALFLFGVDQSFQRAAFYQVFFNQFRNITWFDTAVESAFRIYDYDWTKFAQAKTTCNDKLNFVH